MDYTQKVTDTIEKYPQEELTGILSVVFYYNNPAQEAIYPHFKTILTQKGIGENYLRLPLIPASVTLFEKLAAFKEIQ